MFRFYSLIINLFFLGIAIMSFYVVEQGYSFVLSLSLVFLFFLQSLFLLRALRDNGYIHFFSLFLFAFFATNLLYPAFVYPFNNNAFNLTIFFDKDYINKGLILSYIAFTSVVLGAYAKIVFSKYRPSPTLSPETNVSHLPFTVITFVLFVAFLLTSGSSYLSGGFNKLSLIGGYLLLLMKCTILISAVFYFKYGSTYKGELLFRSLILMYFTLFIWIGDRGPALSLVAALVTLYAFYIRRINISILMPSLMLGIVLFHIVGLGRVVDDDSGTSVLTKGIQRAIEDEMFSSGIGIFHSYIVNVKSLYQGINLVEMTGLNYGESSILPSLLSIIPFGQSVFQALTGLQLLTSSQLFSHLYFGEYVAYGLGTNAISDIYISFGLIGVILVFSLFGSLATKLYYKNLENSSDTWSLCYFVLVSESLYLPRTSLFSLFRIILWTLVIFILVKRLSHIQMNGR